MCDYTPLVATSNDSGKMSPGCPRMSDEAVERLNLRDLRIPKNQLLGQVCNGISRTTINSKCVTLAFRLQA